jgi:hypothetical protein
MKHFVAALALAIGLVLPGTAPAGENWDLVKEAWGEKPWAVILAAPALLVTAPFMLVTSWIDALSRDEDDEDE